MIFTIPVYPAFVEGFHRRATLLVEECHHHARVDRRRAVPEPMLRRESHVLVHLGKLVAGVDSHTQIRGVRNSLGREIRHRNSNLLVRVFVVAHGAAHKPRKPEVLTHFRLAVDFSRKNIVAHAVQSNVAHTRGVVEADFLNRNQLALRHDLHDNDIVAFFRRTPPQDRATHGSVLR